jgi:hypothetical protein
MLLSSVTLAMASNEILMGGTLYVSNNRHTHTRREIQAHRANGVKHSNSPGILRNL